MSMTRTHEKLRAIRQEYNEPFREVVRGYAALGYSKTATREVLGFWPQLFHRLLTQFDLHQYFIRKNYNDSCVPKGKGWPKGKLRRAA